MSDAWRCIEPSTELQCKRKLARLGLISTEFRRCFGDVLLARLRRRSSSLLWRWSWVVGLTARRLCADMVRELCASEVARGALIDFRQHRGVPFQPFRNEPVIDVLLPLFQIGSLHRVLDDVEEERVVENLKKLHVAVANGPLSVALVAPIKRAGLQWRSVGENRQ